MSDPKKSPTAQATGQKPGNDLGRIKLFLSLCRECLTRRAWLFVWITIGIICATAYTQAAAPLLLARLIDLIATDRGDRWAVPFCLVLLASLFAAIGREALWITVGPLQQQIQRQVNRRVFDHLMDAHFDFHRRKSTGEIVESISQGVAAINNLVFSILAEALPVVLRALFILAASAIFLPFIIATVIGVVVAAYIVVLFWGTERIRPRQRRAQLAMVQAKGFLTDACLNVEAIKVFDQQPAMHARYDGFLKITERAFVQFTSGRCLLGCFQGGLMIVALGASLAIAMRGALDGSLTIGSVVLVQTYVFQILEPLQGLSLLYRNIKFALVQLDGLDAVLRTPVEGAAADRVHEAASPAFQGPIDNLEFDAVSLIEDGRQLLAAATFAIPAGSTVAIVGATGSGKSTIARMLLRLVSPSSGAIKVNGCPIGHIPLHELRRRCSFVPQDIVLLNSSLRDNILLSRPDATEADIAAALACAQLADLVTGNAEGLDMRIGQRGQIVSGGERQRVAIARAMLVHADLIIFDEATSALDMETEARILSQISLHNARSIKIFITHRLANTVGADQIFVMDGGRIVQAGRHHELVSADGPYRNMWNAQKAGQAT